MTASVQSLSPAGAVISSGRRIRSVGVEEELLLIDGQTLQLAPVAERIVGGAAHVLASGQILEMEVKREQIEVVSPPLFSLQELTEAIVGGRRAAETAARAVGAHVVAMATSPTSGVSHCVSTPRYDLMRQQFALTMDEQLTCGFHVHVSIDSDEEGVAVLDRIRPWLPVLLALSSNSPFWQGRDTGYASFRYQAWGRWPTSGPYERFGSARSYHEAVRDLLASQVCIDAGMIYFDARLSRHAPTVEVRVADVCLLPGDAAALAVLVRALVNTAVSQWAAGSPADDIATSVLRLASWRASRFGLDHLLMDPRTRTLRPAAEVAAALLDHVDAGFTDASERDQVRRRIASILARGSGARQQRAAMQASLLVVDALAQTHAYHRDLPPDLVA